MEAVMQRCDYRFGNPEPTKRPAFRVTVARPGEAEVEITVLGHVPMAAAMFAAGILRAPALVKIEPMEVT